MDQEHGHVFLPGGIQPAAVQYAPLLGALALPTPPLLKDLELYRNGTPPPGYKLEDEVDGLKQAADQAGLHPFHLVAYSGGGAVALAFIGRYPGRVLSLALVEPAAIPSRQWLEQEAGFWREMSQVMSLPDAQMMPEFVRLQLRPGVMPPPAPAGDPPPWMASRPAGLRAIARAFSEYDLPYERLRLFAPPVYLAVTALSNPVEMRKAEVLKGLFPDARLEVYDQRSHFDPPQRAEPERFAKALQDLWMRAERL